MKKTSAPPVHLLDARALMALVISAQVRHPAAQHWFAAHARPFATCPIAQGTLLRLLIRLGVECEREAWLVLPSKPRLIRAPLGPDFYVVLAPAAEGGRPSRKPASTGISCPVTTESSSSNQHTALAICSGWATLPKAAAAANWPLTRS